MGRLQLILLCALGSCNTYDDSAFDITSGHRVTLALDSRSALADGVSAVSVSVSDSNKVLTSVKLSTTAGVWEEGGQGELTLPLSSDGVGVARLKSSSIARFVYIRATAGRRILLDSATFVAAPPEHIDLTASAVVLPPVIGSSATITATLRRSTGRVSPGYLLTAALLDSTERLTIGIASTASPSSADGVSSFTVVLLKPDYTGRATVVATPLDPALSGLTARMPILIAKSQ